MIVTAGLPTGAVSALASVARIALSPTDSGADTGAKLVTLISQNVCLSASFRKLEAEPFDLILEVLQARVRSGGTLLGLGQIHPRALQQDFELAPFG